MFDKSVSVKTARIVVGVPSVLVAGLILSIGVVRAAPGEPTSSAVPTADIPAQRQRVTAVESRRSVDVEVTDRSTIADLAEVAARPTPPVDRVERAVRAVNAVRQLADVDSLEPTPSISDESSVAFDRLVLVGDSLAVETAPVIEFVTPGKVLVRKFFGGTAPCDWIDDDLEATPTTVVVISFTGNNMTPCMLDSIGARLIDEALVANYRTAVGVLIDHATDAGAWVVLVGQPLHHPQMGTELETEGINAVYREYADAMPNVSYVDAGRFVETPDGRYADRLSCLDVDIDCAPDGTTVVRGDGVHFCPVVDAFPCPVWSSGSIRFGLAIASAANDPASFD
jgi:hypothetical protein